MARTSPTAVARPTGRAVLDLPPAPLTRKIGWIAAFAAWVLVALALVSFDAADAPSRTVASWNQPPANLMGAVGAMVALTVYEAFGFGAWIPMLLGGIALWATFTGRAISHPMVRVVGAVIAMIAFSALHATWFPRLGSLAGAEAGLIPQWFAQQFVARFNGVGTSLILLLALVLGLMVAADELLGMLPKAFARVGEAIEPLWKTDWRGMIARATAKPQPAVVTVGGAAATATDEPKARPMRRKSKAAADVATTDDSNVAVLEADETEAEEAEDVEPECDDEASCDEDESEVEAEEADADDEAPKALTEEELRERMARLPLRMSGTSTTVARDQDIPRAENYEGYQFPGIELLDEPESNFSATIEAFVRDQAATLTQTLATYQIEGEVVEIESGPVVTLYSVELAAGTRVARLETISKDIARALSAPNIRIIANMAGTTAVGIEVPNRQKEKVRLKELMSGGQSQGMRLPMFLGKDSSGEPLVFDLTKMPHMLIAGTTGSGKSVCMNSIIMSWLYTKRPDELKLVLVDPKMVEMSMYANIPHLMAPVVTDMGKASAILEWAVTKMEERYELFQRAQVRDIVTFNDLGETELFERLNMADADEQAKARVPKKFPYLVFVVDELADLMMTNREVETSIVRIAQKARAVGIHLILATQRPQANVVTGLIKANMPCRVAFKVASGVDSRIVLDQKGAELLLGQGDMMVVTPSSSDLRRCQGTLVTDGEIRNVTRFLKDVAQPSFERSLVAIRSQAEAQAAGDTEQTGEFSAERDPMFDRAVEIIIETGRGSVSLLQRRLAIGYGRASRLVDQMGAAGILSDHKGSVAREVLITMEDWQRMKALEAGAEDGNEDGAPGDEGDDSDD
ncbi:MAG: DNA translocase FtsK 4TM domain-containing protein [Planctomycetes bacterium]|nr:DNA translocase FtsK 4TM domain-containing protein [Planctomycetota bacterium]